MRQEGNQEFRRFYYRKRRFDYRKLDVESLRRTGHLYPGGTFEFVFHHRRFIIRRGHEHTRTGN